MKYLHQACLIFGFSFLGEVLHALIPLPIPASIYGMVLLFAALFLGILPAKAVKDMGGFLTSILALLFVAPAVGLIDHWALLKDNLPAILLILTLTTVLTFAVSGRVTQWMVEKKEGKRHD